MKTENVEFLWDSEIVALLHNEKLTGIQIRNVKTGEESTLACDGVFVSVGRKPSTELVKEQLRLIRQAIFLQTRVPAPISPVYLPWGMSAQRPYGRS